MSNTLCDQIVINLTVLSKIQENGRLCTSSGWTVCIEKDSYLQGLWRSLTGDSRKSTIRRVRQIAQDAIEYTKERMSYMHDVYKKLVHGGDTEVNHYERERFDTYRGQIHTIRSKMVDAADGIERLKITYKDDFTTLAELDVIVDMMRTHISKLEEHTTEYSALRR